MIVADIFLYALFAWYFGNIFPGEYGTSKPLYFFLQKSYWWEEEAEEKQEPLLRKQRGGKVGIEIENLSKTYSKGFCKSSFDVAALKELSLTINKSQIFGLLGSNGAGKTTTISLLTGLFPPSSGNAYMNGYSIRREMDRVRQSLGVCCQQDVLFDHLNVEEHIKLFSYLRGEKEPQIDCRMREVGLKSETKFTLAKELSGGMKRKLCICLAFIGNPSIVFLDEPTSGVDPLSRKEMWSFFQRKKIGRTIILTTHVLSLFFKLKFRIFS